MTIHKSKGELVVECDECGAEAFGGTLEWAEFWEDVKAQGWRARKVEDGWEHHCPDCTEGRA